MGGGLLPGEGGGVGVLLPGEGCWGGGVVARHSSG